MKNTITSFLSLIKFSHTIFAMPFALVGYSLAVFLEKNHFSWYKLLLVVLCMVFARSAAMAFNRYIDRAFDKLNTRTAQREIPAGVISARSALFFVIASSMAFITCSLLLNRLCFYLSPVALVVILGYSLTKRFTALCHFVLGLGLSLAPVGAYIAVTGHFSLVPVLFSLVVITWTGGFDILYALQDESFDKSQSLHSIPVAFGRKHALLISIGAHVVTALLVLGIGFIAPLHYIYWPGALIFISLLAYQHSLVKPDDISKVTIAFATTNGLASLVFGIFTIISTMLS
jgi:4-hydroxybenzoate polyprenyltransferase